MSTPEAVQCVTPVILQELSLLENALGLPSDAEERKSFLAGLSGFLHKCFEKFEKDSNKASFEYVGLLEYPTEQQNYMLYFLPKYYDIRKISAATDIMDPAMPVYQHFSLVLKTINRYRQEKANNAIKENRLQSQFDWSEDDICLNSKLAVAVTLIEDYLENGVYTNMKTCLNRCGSGEIDWAYTIHHVDPVIDANRPCYFDYWTTDRVPNTETEIARLHEAIVKDCSLKLCQYGLPELLDLETPCPYEGELSDFGDPEHIAELIKRELSAQFVTQKQILLNMMLAYVKKENTAASDGLSMFGTSSFHSVWENVCGRVFGNQLDEPVDRKFLPESEIFKKVSKWSDIESRSIWTIDGSEAENVASEEENSQTDKQEGGKLKPDFVALKKEQGILYILDAKYHIPEFRDKSVSDCPGVGEVNKQHLYQLCYQPLIKKNNWQVINAFLMPEYHGNFNGRKKRVSVCCSLFENMQIVYDGSPFQFAKIQTIFLAPRQLFQDYLQGNSKYLDNPLLSDLEYSTELSVE